MIVCLAGMHRSGTSLFSSYLNYNSIHMGRTMASAGHGNARGHFEDKEFLELHKEILKKNNANMYRAPDYLNISNKLTNYARSLIDSNNEKYKNWGWKDPRTTLFLDFWDSLEPDIKYIFLYREPHSVIDSLFRRKGERFFYMNPLLAADAWCMYNEKVLEFSEKHPEKCAIVSISGINCNSDEAIPKLSKWLGLALSKHYSDVYHPSEISNKLALRTKLYKPLIHMFRGNKIDSIYAKLEERALIDSSGT